MDEALKQLNDNYSKKIAEYAEKARTIETSWLDERLSTQIDAVLAGRAFVGADPTATAAMVRRLLKDEIEAVRDDKGSPVIRDRKTLRPAAEYLKERLDSPDFAVFFAATNRGGAGTDGARPAAATPNTPGNPNEEFAKMFLAAKAASQNARF